MARMPSFLSSLARGLATPSAGVGVPGFTLDRQNHENWCWAAVTQAVERALGNDQISQGAVASDHIAATRGGNCGDFDPSETEDLGCGAACQSPCNAPHSLGRVLKERDRFAGSTKYVEPGLGDRPDYDEVKAELTEGRPVPCRIQWSDAQGGGHFVCISACADDGGDRQQVTFWDPSDPGIGVGPADREELPWEDFRDGYRLGTRKGWVSHVYQVRD